jgi:hypothetical protein
MKGKADAVEFDDLSEWESGDPCVGAQALDDEGPRCVRAEVTLRSGTEVIAMGVRDDRAVDRKPRIDVEAAGGAVEACAGWLN